MHFEVHNISLTFPKFEMFELGSQVRRSSNSAPANIFIESINRAIGEYQEMQHHLSVASYKKYITKVQYEELENRYTECIKMLFGLRKKPDGK